jgi:FemAB-related protein (PEP-CTERM system-associated)
VAGSPDASPYHCLAFCDAVASTYRLKPRYVIAQSDSLRISGVLPLFHVPSLLSASSIVSLPFCDYGGIVCGESEAGLALLAEALAATRQHGCPLCELLQKSELSFWGDAADLIKSHGMSSALNTRKVQLWLELEADADKQFNRFPAKLRSQIRKPGKEGCTALSGGLELLDDYYRVFVHNMRDLGSPVHSRKLMRELLKRSSDTCRLFVVYRDNTPLACSLVIGFSDTLVNPWASSDRRFQQIAPNMLLYWTMIEWAIQNGYHRFDFGRSTEGEGTYRFKRQWGAEPVTLHWYYIAKNAAEFASEKESKKKQVFINLWQKLPLWATRTAGPLLRRQISL